MVRSLLTRSLVLVWVSTQSFFGKQRSQRQRAPSGDSALSSQLESLAEAARHRKSVDKSESTECRMATQGVSQGSAGGGGGEPPHKRQKKGGGPPRDRCPVCRCLECLCAEEAQRCPRCNQFPARGDRSSHSGPYCHCLQQFGTTLVNTSSGVQEQAWWAEAFPQWIFAALAALREQLLRDTEYLDAWTPPRGPTNY